MTTFQSLGLSAPLLKALDKLNFTTPTDIQQKAIPQLLAQETDMIGLAQTGTGKTAAFGLPLLEKINSEEKAVQGLVIAPTRELCRQISEELERFSKYEHKIDILPVYGGANISTQIKALKSRPQIVIATPGRLIDLINRKTIKLHNIKYVVLDEADEMLNMGFKEDIDKILSYTTDQKKTWLFSATMPSAIKAIVNTYMQDPVEIQINAKNRVNKNIEHQYVIVHNRDKSEALRRFLDLENKMRGVVFCRTRRDTQELAERLLQRGYQADALHGEMTQNQRERVMRRFKEGSLQVLIATDVAARGIDVEDLTHVFHYSLPDDNAYYTHRSGRTARAGKEGISISFVSNRELKRISRLEQQLKIKMKRVLIPQIKDIAAVRIQNWCQEVVEAGQNNTKINPALFEIMLAELGEMSKETLLHSLLAKQMKTMNLNKEKDLNNTHKSSKRSHEGGQAKHKRKAQKRHNRKGPKKSKRKSQRRYRGA